MEKPLNTIMLIDDREEDNFLHKRVIKKSGFEGNLIVIDVPEEALNLLNPENQDADMPDLIFLDLNMPRTNGWELLEQYSTLVAESDSHPVLYILSTNDKPSHETFVDSVIQPEGFLTKPLTPAIFQEIREKHFSS